MLADAKTDKQTTKTTTTHARAKKKKHTQQNTQKKTVAASVEKQNKKRQHTNAKTQGSALSLSSSLLPQTNQTTKVVGKKKDVDSVKESSVSVALDISLPGCSCRKNACVCAQKRGVVIAVTACILPAQSGRSLCEPVCFVTVGGGRPEKQCCALHSREQQQRQP